MENEIENATMRARAIAKIRNLQNDFVSDEQVIDVALRKYYEWLIAFKKHEILVHKNAGKL